MYTDHAEFDVVVRAPVGQVFDWLDDQMRLSQHMSKRSWKMGWGKMEIELDGQRGRAVGSHIMLRGRVLGIRLDLDEVVVQHEPPARKSWETVGEPRLLVVGAYLMGFELTPIDGTSKLRVFISYRLPARGISRLMGRILGPAYARWCVRKMAEDARSAFAGHAAVPA